MTDVYAQNLAKLKQRFPALAGRLPETGESVALSQSPDGGYFYAVPDGTGGWKALTDHQQPVERARQAVVAYENVLANTQNPALVVGLCPGFVLDMVHNFFKDVEKKTRFFRRIYVVATSVETTVGWLKATDRSAYLEHPDIEFYWHEDVNQIAEKIQSDRTRSHNFMPMSVLPEAHVNQLITPLAELFLKRQEEEERLKIENDSYYDAISDDQLAGIISGGGDRKPRLLFATHSSSTVVQYSARDLCEALEDQGWDTRIHMSTHGCSNWEVVKTINEYKPDVYLMVNHLRTEGKANVHPKNMTFITWMQDSPSYILNREAAEEWNAMAAGDADRMTSLPDEALAKTGDQLATTKSTDEGGCSVVRGGSSVTSEEDRESLESRDGISCQRQDHVEPSSSLRDLRASVANPPSSETPSPTFNDLQPSPESDRKRDLIIGYTDQLKPYGYREDRLVEMPMIVNTRIFRPRELTEEQKEKYGCDVMFASRCGAPTEERIDELYEDFNEIRKIPTDRSLLQAIHDHLWTEYRAGKTFTCEPSLRAELLGVAAFEGWFAELMTEDQNYISQRLYWRLNDVIYRHVVVEWLCEFAENHSDFSLFLYGDGWDRHPRFCEHYRGSLQHGDELSVAYRAANLCLHLSSAEGAHQRLWEIFSSGGIPLTRCVARKDLISGNLARAFRKYAVGGQDFSQGEREALSDYVFSVARSILVKQPDLDPNLCSPLVCQRMRQRMDSFPDWFLEEWHQVNFDSHASLCSALTSPRKLSGALYSGTVDRFLAGLADLLGVRVVGLNSLPSFCDPVLNACFELSKGAGAELGEFLQSPETSGVAMAIADHYLSTNNVDRAREALTKLEIAKLTPDQRASFAAMLASCGDIESARAEIERAYSESAKLTDGYAKLGWKCFWPSRKADEVIELCMADEDAGRLSPWMRIQLANAYAAAEDLERASDQVRLAYTLDTSLRDGYSRVGWTHFVERSQDYRGAVPYLQMDLDQGRISDSWRKNYAVAQACLGHFDEASYTIGRLYSSNRQIANGFSVIAWGAFVTHNSRFDKALSWFEKDLESGRLRDDWQDYYVVALGAVGEVARALDFISSQGGSRAMDLAAALAYHALVYRRISPIEANALLDDAQLCWGSDWRGCLFSVGVRAAQGDVHIEDELRNLPFIKSTALWSAMTFAPHSVEVADVQAAVEEDIQQCGFSSWWAMWAAAMAARSGQLDEAVEMVTDLYRDDFTLRNAYSVLALSATGFPEEPEKYCWLFEKDYNEDRINPGGLLTWGLYASDEPKKKRLCSLALEKTNMAPHAASIYAPFLPGLVGDLERFAKEFGNG